MYQTSRTFIEQCTTDWTVVMARLESDPRIASSYSLVRAAVNREQMQSASGSGNEASILKFVARSRADRSLVGAAILNHASLSYFVVPERWRQGYGSEIVAAVCDFALTKLGLKEIEALVVEV